MKITPEYLEKQWNGINYTDGGFLQIDTQHPLEWHIGYQSISQRTLLILCDVDIGKIVSSKSMIVNQRRRESDNRWTLSFELLRDEQQEVFAILCCDIIEHSRFASCEEEALNLVLNRYKQWSKLLESQKSGMMDENRRKGLLGELLFLEKRIATSDIALSAVQGWVGAEGADQDFVYPEGWYEVKSIGVSTTSVTISSLEQLDCPDLGELVIQRIDKVAPDKSKAVTLNEIVGRISEMLIGDAEAMDLFRSKLSEYGYIDLQEYSEQKYFHAESVRFSVNETFPKLTRKNVQMQITNASYELSVPALSEWGKD
jgi:hypothetical protein